MLPRLTHATLLRYAGLFTWAMVGSGLVMNALFVMDASSSPLPAMAFVGPVGAYVAFGVAFWLSTQSLGHQRGRVWPIVLMLAMAASAIAVSALTNSALGAILMMVMAAVVPWSTPSTWGWLACSGVRSASMDVGPDGAHNTMPWIWGCVPRGPLSPVSWRLPKTVGSVPY